MDYNYFGGGAIHDKDAAKEIYPFSLVRVLFAASSCWFVPPQKQLNSKALIDFGIDLEQ